MAKETTSVRMQAQIKMMFRERLLDPCHCPGFEALAQNGVKDLRDGGGRVQRAGELD